MDAPHHDLCGGKGFRAGWGPAGGVTFPVRGEGDDVPEKSPEKRKRVFVILRVVVVLLLLAAVTGFVFYRSYYPMDGEVRILAKEHDHGFTITIEQGFREGQKTAQYKLRCTEEQYDSVEIGDIVDCSRYQSALTSKGNVHRFH